MKAAPSQWIAAFAVSLAAHVALFFVLWIAAEPDPVEPQSVAEARLDMASYEVDRTTAEPRTPDASAVEEEQAIGASVSGATVPVSRAESAPVSSGPALQPAAPQQETISAEIGNPAIEDALDPNIETTQPVLIESASAPLRPFAMAASTASTVSISPNASATQLALSGSEALINVSPSEGEVLTAALDSGTRVDAASTAPIALESKGPQGTEIGDQPIVGAPSEPQRPDAQMGARLDPGAVPAIQQAAAGFAARPDVASPEGEFATASLAWSGAGGAPVDPISMAAIQAFMRPGDIGASASNAGEVRDDIEALLASVPCARLQTTFVPETGKLELRGHVPEDGVKAPVLAALQAHVGSAIPVADNLLVLPRPQCGALQGIGAVGLPQSTDQLTNSRVVGSDAHARVYDFAEGDRLEFDLVGADYDAVLYIDYYDADGNVLHLQPNEYLPLEVVEAQSTLMIGADRQGRPSLEITVAPPFGQEIMVAMATSHPLYDGLRPIIEPAETYLAFMRERVAETRSGHSDFKGEWVYFFVRTASR